MAKQKNEEVAVNPTPSPAVPVEPEVGKFDLVAYYPNGDKIQDPEVAIVTKRTPTGLDLWVFGDRTPLRRKSVRQMDDPWYTDPTFGAERKKRLFEDGCWDTVSSAKARMNAATEEAKAAVKRRQEAEQADRQSIIDQEPLLTEVAMEVEDLARQGFELPDICAAMRGKATPGQITNHLSNTTISA